MDGDGLGRVRTGVHLQEARLLLQRKMAYMKQRRDMLGWQRYLQPGVDDLGNEARMGAEGQCELLACAGWPLIE